MIETYFGSFDIVRNGKNHCVLESKSCYLARYCKIVVFNAKTKQGTKRRTIITDFFKDRAEHPTNHLIVNSEHFNMRERSTLKLKQKLCELIVSIPNEQLFKLNDD